MEYYSNKMKYINKLKLINIDNISNLPDEYPVEFIKFCKNNNLKPPKITCANGKALSVMIKYKDFYFNRKTCDAFVKKFDMDSKDSIQLFNKHSQWGIKTNSGTIKGKYYIEYPYCLSGKYRLNVPFDGSNEQKNILINNIKSTIKHDYIDVPNDLWQIGHKNPHIIDDSKNNIVLQPPIQGAYRDNYIFIDTITKMPTPKKLSSLVQNKKIQLSPQQIDDYINLFMQLKVNL